MKNRKKNFLETIEYYVYEIHDKFSIFKCKSKISRINKNVGLKFVKVSNDNFEL